MRGGLDFSTPLERTLLFGLAGVLSAAAFLVSGSEGVQLLVVVACMVGVSIALRRTERSRGTSRVPDGLHPPLSVAASEGLLAAACIAVLYVLAGAVELGGYFWLWPLLWAFVEIDLLLTSREIERHGLSRWRRARPVREALLWGLVTAAVMTPIALFMAGAPPGEAFLAAGLCGLFVGAFGLATAWQERRRDAR